MMRMLFSSHRRQIDLHLTVISTLSLMLRHEPFKKIIEAIVIEIEGQKVVPVGSMYYMMGLFGFGKLPNEKKQAVEMMTYLAAYIKVAKKRCIDSLPMIIHRLLFNPMEKLHEEFQAIDGMSLLRGSPQIENRRHQLSVQMEVLRLAQRF